MVQVSKKLVLEFQQILKEDYGKELSFAEVFKMANDLVGYFTLLADIYAKDETLHDKKPEKKKDN